MRVLATHSLHQFPLHFPSRAPPCATRFRTSSKGLRSCDHHMMVGCGLVDGLILVAVFVAVLKCFVVE